MRDNIVRLDDGRTLGFSDYGRQDGIPIFFFHGTPGSRISGLQLEPLIEKYGIRVIAPERPGYGLSDPFPKRTIAGWATDVAALADHLQIDRFHVAGESGGAPYVLACAVGLPDRVLSVTLVASATPVDMPRLTEGMAKANRLGLLLARYAPPFLFKRAYEKVARGVQAEPEKFVRQLLSQMSEWDRRIIMGPEGTAGEEEAVLDVREAFRQGAAGVSHDALLLTRPWRLDLNRIKAPVFLWHGEADTLVPIAPARQFARLLPRCESHFIPGAGHALLTSPEVGSEIVARLLSAG